MIKWCLNSIFRNQLGVTLYAEYISASARVKRLTEEECEFYSKNPNEHPQYKTLSIKFASSIHSLEANGSELPNLWQKYWSSCFKAIKEKMLEEKLNELREKFIKKRLEEEISASGSVCTPSNRSFNLDETLELIDKFSTSLDAVGAALRTIVTKCRHLGTTTPQALAIFTDEENIVLLKLALEKLKGLKQKSDGKIMVQYDTAIVAIKNLLKFAKENSIVSKSLDIEKIAKATIGKNSTHIVDMIRTACIREGDLTPSNEKINKLFLDVCNIHFKLMS